MKQTILYFTMLLALLFGAVSCRDSFLEENPVLTASEDTIFQDSVKLSTAVNGVYDRIKNGYFLGGFVTLVGDNRSDDVLNLGANARTLTNVYNFNVTANASESSWLFQYAYLAINYANILIDGIDVKYASSLPCSPGRARRYETECKFLRSLAFYYLSQLYGLPYSVNPAAASIPLRTEPVETSGWSDCPSAAISQVYEQILSDTGDASSLPSGYGAAGFDVTKASQAAVHALRMRVYMCRQEWQHAVEEGLQIEGFDLIPDLATMFDAPYANTVENIFSMPMTTADRSGVQTHPVALFSHEAGDIDVLNSANGIAVSYGVEDDARSRFIYKGEPYWHYEKYNELSTRLEWIPIFRYAEILLNLSECYYQIGDEDRARQCLRRVRTRSIDAEADPLVSYSETGIQLREAIYNERRWEFLGEGLRGYDLMRRGEDFRHPTSGGAWETVAAPSDPSRYCWSFPVYETAYNSGVSN